MKCNKKMTDKVIKRRDWRRGRFRRCIRRRRKTRKKERSRIKKVYDKEERQKEN